MALRKQDVSAPRSPRRLLAALNLLIVAAAAVHLFVLPDRPDATPPRPDTETETETRHPYMGRLRQSAASGPRRGIRVLQWLDGGIESTPCVGPDGTLYVGSGRMAWERYSYLGEPGMLALDGKTGSVRWQKPLDGFVTQPIVLRNGSLIVQTQRLDGSKYVPQFHLADAATGETFWFQSGTFVGARSPHPRDEALYGYLSHQSGQFTSRGGYTSGTDGEVIEYRYRRNREIEPARILSVNGPKGLIGFGADGRVYTAQCVRENPNCFRTIACRRNGTGAALWTFETAWDSRILGKPTLSADGKHLYFVMNNCRLIALRTDNGEKAWEAKTLATTGPVVAGPDGSLAVPGYAPGSGDSRMVLRAHDARTGRTRWQVGLGDSVASGWAAPPDPVIGRDGTVYAALSDRLIAFEGKTGAVRWSAIPPRDYRFHTGAAVAPDDTVYVGAEYHSPDSAATGTARSGSPLGCIVMIRRIGSGGPKGGAGPKP